MTESLKYFNNDDLAASVFMQKYAAPGETTPDDMHKRMAGEFARIEQNYIDYEKTTKPQLFNVTLSDYGESREDLTEEKIYNLFKRFSYIVPQGSVMSILGSNKVGSLSNCFVVGQPHDSYGGIMYKDQQLVQLMKRRGGVGTDISTLRPANTPVTNAAGTSTGAVLFMERFSNSTREVAQDGRRGALMISIDVRHPDVKSFATIKQDLSKVTGANISIQLRNDFMQAVQSDSDYILRWPCNIDLPQFSRFEGKDYTVDMVRTDFLNPYNELIEHKHPDTGKVFYTKRIKARDLWETIIKCAHATAEPGLMFLDKHWDYSPDTVYPQYKGVTTNPCGEIFMQEGDACRLLALNFFSFVKNPFTSEAEFDYQKLYEMAYEQQRLADDLIDLELERIDAIIKKVESDPEPAEVKQVELDLWHKIKNVAMSSRRTGSGFTALGDAIAALGLKYDSDEALKVIDKIMESKFLGELDCTIDMAKLRGTFSGFSPDLEFMIAGDEQNGWAIIGGCNPFYEMIFQKYPKHASQMCNFGHRNVSWSTVAPTGSVSILTQTTSGLEPLFSWGYMRRKKVNPGDKTSRIDFTDQNGDSWMEYPVLHPKFKMWLDVHVSLGGFYNIESLTRDELEEHFKNSPWYGSTANDIDWNKRVEIQSIIQKYTTHSISTTLNLPNDVSLEEVSDIYMKSWEMNLKGQTIYRDGSRSGVLVNLDSDKPVTTFEQHDAPKRPVDLNCNIHHVKSKGQDYTVVVGLLDNKPYEVFIVPMKIAADHESGMLSKKKSGVYNLVYSFDEEIMILRDLTENMTDEQEAITRLISTSLRHGADIKFVVEQLQKTEGDLNSFVRVIARILKKYIPEGEKSTLKCHDCGGSNVVFQEGCAVCMDCGSSKCG